MLAASLKVKKLEAHGNGGYIEFEPTADINPMFLVSLLQKDPTGFALDGPTKVKFIKDLTERQTRIKYVMDLLKLFNENRI